MNEQYDTVDQMWKDMIREVTRYGHTLHSRAGGSTEIIGWQGILVDPRNNFITYPERKLSLSYACAELLWYLSMERDIDLIKAYAPSYVNFSDDGKTANGAYGYRWKYNLGFETANIMFATNFTSQLHAVIELLKEDPNTRQAIITMWDSKDLINSYVKLTKDTPCTLTWTFFLRDNNLHMVCNIRSNDLWMGFPYDLFCNTCIQQIIAHSLGVELGNYIHQVGSLHLYNQHLTKAYNVLGADITPVYPAHNYEVPRDINKDIELALQYEQKLRISGTFCLDSSLVNFLYSNYLMRDVVLGCATKWRPNAAEHINNELWKVNL